MKTPTIEAECEICGGTGDFRALNIHHLYMGASVVHKDNSVCLENMRIKKEAQGSNKTVATSLSSPQ